MAPWTYSMMIDWPICGKQAHHWFEKPKWVRSSPRKTYPFCMLSSSISFHKWLFCAVHREYGGYVAIWETQAKLCWLIQDETMVLWNALLFPKLVVIAVRPASLKVEKLWLTASIPIASWILSVRSRSEILGHLLLSMGPKKQIRTPDLRKTLVTSEYGGCIK